MSWPRIETSEIVKINFSTSKLFQSFVKVMENWLIHMPSNIKYPEKIKADKKKKETNPAFLFQENFSKKG